MFSLLRPLTAFETAVSSLGTAAEDLVIYAAYAATLLIFYGGRVPLAIMSSKLVFRRFS
jgi:hypothetical protein